MNNWFSSVVTSLSAKERRLVDSIAHAVHATGGLQTILTQSFNELTELIPAASGSLCVSKSTTDSPGFHWFPINFHPDWFAEYASMGPHDFVFRAVSALPNVVLRDEDMLPRSLFESNQMYKRSRKIGFPLEHVMAVSFAAADAPISGISLFRNERGGFSRHEQKLMQMLSPIYHDRIRSCALLDRWSIKTAVFERLFGLNDAAVIAFAQDGHELFRSNVASTILARWFRNDRVVPDGVLQRVHKFQAEGLRGEPGAWVINGNEADLVATLFNLEFPGGVDPLQTVTCLVLREATHHAAPPMAWSKLLTRRELEVAAYVLQGRTNEAIAALSDCAPKTVKKHLEHIYDKLGVSSRAAMCSLARRRE